MVCGIAGELNWEEAPSPHDLEPVVSSMVHRGPDAGAIDGDGPVVFGHRRLSVIDTRAVSNQPLWDTGRTVCITFNGEIYNYQEVRRELEKGGARFQTLSDTEVILQAYLKWGPRCLDKLVGMFAFGLWDKQQQQLLLARDRMGEKPLYYFESRTGLVFASELKAIMRHPQCPREVNPAAIGQFLSLNYLLTDCCILNSVRKLPPAHYLLIGREKRAEVTEYWSLRDAFLHKPQWQSYRQAEDRLNELLEQSLQGQLISDVPLGAFLSGGIDSSTIVAHMKRLGGADRVKTYSIGFEERSYNEIPESCFVSDFLGVDHNTKVVHPTIEDELLAIINAFDEPFADTSMIPTYYLCRFTRKNVTVALSGDGGDELFLGYETYLADKLQRVVSRFPAWATSGLSTAVDRLWPVSFNKVSLDYKLRQFLKGAQLSEDAAHYSWRTIFSQEEKRHLLKDASAAETEPVETFSSFWSEVDGCHYLDKASYVDMKTWLPDDILVKVDRAAMAHSLETRTPFLDHRLVEFAAGLPVEWKLRGRMTKAILKKSQENFLPRDTLYQKKKGFNAPISHWISGELRGLARSATYESPLAEWINRDALDQLWRQHDTKTRDNGLRLFGLTCLGLWLEQQRGEQ